MSVVHEPRKLYQRIKPHLGDGSTLLIGQHAANVFIRLLSNIILTRLLAPEAYGVVGIVTSISYILIMVSDMGLRAYITRHKTASPEAIQTIWTIRLIRNIALAAIMFIGAEVFASLYSAPEVTLAIRISSALFLIEGFAALSHFTTERERRVIRLTFIDFSRLIFVTLITLVAAYFLRSYWAIIISMFFGSLFSLVVSYTLLKGPPVRLRFDMAHARELWRFSRIVIPASIISIVLTQTDKFFLARFFPLAELGKFMLATTIAMAVQGVLTQYVMRVFYPKFAETHRQHPDQSRAVFHSAKRNIILFLAFGVGGLIGGAELLTRILFNDNYLGAGFYLSILCLQPLGKLSSFPAEQALIAKGFIRISLMANILRLLWVFSAGVFAYFQWGPLAVVIVMSMTEIILLPFFWRAQHRHNLLNMREEFYIFALAGVGFSIGFACNAFINGLIAAGHIPSF